MTLWMSAQRLSASKVLSRPEGRTKHNKTTGAQRLSASKVLSQKDFTKIPNEVVGVLNAFRHQRFFHTNAVPLRNNSRMCSTPFGIKGSFTRLTLWTFAQACRAQRLSASKVLSLRDIKPFIFAPLPTRYSRFHDICNHIELTLAVLSAFGFPIYLI